MSYVIFILFFVLIFIFFFFRIYLFLIPKKRLTVLMYHSIQPESKNELTVSVKNFEKHLEVLQKKGYNTLHFKQLKTPLTKKNLIITFDDGYIDNKDYAFPLLEKFGFKGVVFLPTALINHDSDKMTFDDLKTINSDVIELGLHSHKHQNFEKINLSQIKNDLLENMDALQSRKIPFERILAYPYGRFQNNKDFFQLLETLGIKYAVRISNKINYFPPKNRFKICRIDVKGTDSILKFKLKLIFGKIKL